jgi:hypothetical protein
VLISASKSSHVSLWSVIVVSSYWAHSISMN